MYSPMCSGFIFLAAVIIVFDRIICLFQLDHEQNTGDHLGDSVSRGQLCKGPHKSRAGKTGLSKWCILEKWRQTFPRARGRSQERLHIAPCLSQFKPDPYGEGQRSAYLAVSGMTKPISSMLRPWAPAPISPWVQAVRWLLSLQTCQVA